MTLNSLIQGSDSLHEVLLPHISPLQAVRYCIYEYVENVIIAHLICISGSRDSSVVIETVTGWFDSRPGQEIYLFSAESRPVLGPTQPPVRLV
jgi:hypothetical protein